MQRQIFSYKSRDEPMVRRGGKLQSRDWPFTMITINSDRLWSRMEALSRFTDPARPWTRRAFDNQFAQGRAWLEEEFKANNLQKAACLSDIGAIANIQHECLKALRAHAELAHHVIGGEENAAAVDSSGEANTDWLMRRNRP